MINIAEIKEKKMRCAIRCKTQEEINEVVDYLGTRFLYTNDEYKKIGRRLKEERFSDGIVLGIVNGIIDGYDNTEFFKENLKFGRIYDYDRIKEGNNLMFTFKTENTNRVDKTCNQLIPQIRTEVELYLPEDVVFGSATCDEKDYDARQGVLEALANAICDGDFDKIYYKASRLNKWEDRYQRRCTYCGKICDTIEDKIEHEAWHIECRKAKRERYLLRKRAKEIAFEEQAQKMAKEMIEK